MSNMQSGNSPWESTGSSNPDLAGDPVGEVTLEFSDSGGSVMKTTNLVFAFANGFKQSLLGAVKREAPRQQDEEDDSAAPHIHGFAVRLSLHHLRGHKVRSSNTTCGYKEVSRKLNADTMKTDNSCKHLQHCDTSCFH